MNVVFLSPHFPTNYFQFALHLRNLGVNVLGLADVHYDSMHQELKNSLTEYYRVSDMHNYDELLRALGYFTHRYGKIDRIVSQNEYWLETEAKLRTDFNIPGVKTDKINRTKRKSEMKEIFRKAGVTHARGIVVNNLKEAQKFIKEVGYPVVAKPDIGVGAAFTFKITSPEDLEHLFNIKTDVEYIMEEYVKGRIFSFDGIVDKDGKIVFTFSNVFSRGIMEVVNENDNLWYYSLREIPEDLRIAGEKLVRAFELKETFFHFEFFRLDDGSLVALEVNIRPPGGLTTDMFNYACDIDVYKGWANVVAHNKFYDNFERKYHVLYIGRKHDRHYSHSHDEIMWKLQNYIVHDQPMSQVFSAVMGNHGYLARSESEQDILEIIEFIHS